MGKRLYIDNFTEINVKRAIEGFKTYDNVPITFWTTAITGELGELCNMIKKIERVRHGGIDGGTTYTAATLSMENIEEEVGGIFIYLNLLCSRMGINMEEAIIKTFNKKSEKYGFEQKY